MTQPNSLYIPGLGRLYHLHPLTKLAYLLSTLLSVFLGPAGLWIGLALAWLALLLAWQSGLLRPVLRGLLHTVTPLAAMMFLVHGLFGPDNRTVLWAWGPLSLGREGLAYALLVSVRLTAALAASLLLVFTTHPRSLMLALETAGAPPALTYLLGSPLLLIPQVRSRAETILAAQRSRGMETEGNLVRRLKALFPLIGPLVFGLLIEVEERAVALETRAFTVSGRKTSLVALEDSPGQRVARWGMFGVALVLAMIGIVLRLNGAD